METDIAVRWVQREPVGLAPRYPRFPRLLVFQPCSTCTFYCRVAKETGALLGKLERTNVRVA